MAEVEERQFEEPADSKLRTWLGQHIFKNIATFYKAVTHHAQVSFKATTSSGGPVGIAISDDFDTNPVGLNGFVRIGIGQGVVTRNLTNTGDHILIGSNLSRAEDTCLGDGDYYTDINGYDLQINPKTGDIVINQNSVAAITFFTANAVVNSLCVKAGRVGIGTANPGTKLSVVGLPTSAAGLGTGDIWIDTTAGNVLKIVT